MIFVYILYLYYLLKMEEKIIEINLEEKIREDKRNKIN